MEEDSVSLREHLEKVIYLNDQRYTEVNTEREKALKIKEEADKIALSLASEIQKYKDEKANELREQINSERNLYPTKTEIKPLVDYVSSQQGRSQGLSAGWGYLVGGIGLVIAIISFLNK